jgi:hypothetical protein
MNAPARLAEFDSYGPDAENATFDHFGKSSLEEIERILGKPSPDWNLREELALALWKYARATASQDGGGRELPALVRQYAEAIDTAARSLRDALHQIGVSASFSRVGRRPRQRSQRSFEEVHWAKLSPLFRAAHNRLREARGLLPIPEPEPDLYEPPRGVTIRPSDPADPEAVADVAAGTVAIVLDAAGVNTTVVLEQLEAILSATAKVDTSTGGRPADVERGLLMYRAAELFAAATGTPAEVKWNSLKESSSSPFFEMARAIDKAAASATEGELR